MIKIRDGVSEEADKLSALCFASKNHWGYSDQFMASCREELSITAHDFENDIILVAEYQSDTAGVAQMKNSPEASELEKLFIAPKFIGHGVGKALFAKTIEKLKTYHLNLKGSAKHLKIVSDPYAKEFYLKMGAVEAGSEASKTWPNRELPVLHYHLQA